MINFYIKNESNDYYNHNSKKFVSLKTNGTVYHLENITRLYQIELLQQGISTYVEPFKG